MNKDFYVYILTTKKNGTLYVGVTSNLLQRVWKHKNNYYKGFTKQYSVKQLVYYEHFENSEHAFQREKQIKNWQRKWKIDLIESKNPLWKDLYEKLKL